MGENVEHHATRCSPTPEEFEEARKRELARLNVRLSDLTGEQYHTSEDLKLVEDDTEQQRSADKETVRLWTANSEKYGEGTKSA
jgi:hypothetical protein